MISRAAIVLALLLAPISVAHADEKTDCTNAHFEGQRLRGAGQLRKARDRFLTCAKTTCPGAVQVECVQFLSELDVVQPSIVVDARDESGEPILDVRVSVDGEPIADRLNGLALNVDPGEHMLRFTLKDGKVKEQRVVMLERDRARRVSVRFGPGSENPPASSDSASGAAPRQDVASRDDGGVPASFWVLGAFGGAALVTGGVFGSVALAKRSHLGDTCGSTRTCDAGEVSTMHTYALVADISLAVGAGAVLATTALFLTRKHSDSKTAAALSAFSRGLTW